MATPTPDPTSAAWSIYLENQSFNLTGLDGTPTPLTLTDLDAYNLNRARQACIYGFCFGFTIMIFLVMIPMTQSRQRRTPIFILNLISLFLFSVKNICSMIIQSSTYQGVATIFLGADAQYSMSTFAPRFIAILINIPLFLSITTSLVLQFRVAFAASPKTQRIVTWVAIIAAGGHFVLNTVWQVAQMWGTWHFEEFVDKYLVLYKVTTIYFICFVGIGSSIFLYKLGMTIYRRRKMGMDTRSFGPLQIIFVFFAQSLVIPTIIHAVNYSTNVSNLQYLADAFLICSLPLSALWAAAEVDKPNVSTIRHSTNSDSDSSKRSTGGWSRKRKSPELKESVHSMDTDLEKAPSYSTDVHSTIPESH